MRTRYPAALLALTMLAACGEKKKVDWKNRDLPWKYGPQTGTASATHLAGTGKQGKGPIAEGWKIGLRDGNTITVQPFKLAKDHALFGKATLAVGMFDRDSQPIDTVVSSVITNDNHTFTFEIPVETAKKIWDLILWFRDA